MIRIRGPEFLTPIPQGRVFRIEHKGQGRECYPLRESLGLSEVAKTLDEMQDVMPLNFVGDYDIVCLDQQLTALDAAGNPFADIAGERFNGWIALSGRVPNLRDILVHEVAHEWWASLTPLDWFTFWRSVNMVPDSPEHPEWHMRPQEISAEWITAALFGEPVDPRMVQPTEVQLDAIRGWAKSKLMRSSRALIATDVPFIEVVVKEGDNFALVNGVKTPLVADYPDAIAETRNEFFSLPMAFITKLLKGSKSWDKATRTGTFRIPM